MWGSIRLLSEITLPIGIELFAIIYPSLGDKMSGFRAFQCVTFEEKKISRLRNVSEGSRYIPVQLCGRSLPYLRDMKGRVGIANASEIRVAQSSVVSNERTTGPRESDVGLRVGARDL